MFKAGTYINTIREDERLLAFLFVNTVTIRLVYLTAMNYAAGGYFES